MLDTLQKMSGTTHKSYTDSKTITRDQERMFMKNEGKVSYTMTTKEVPVISYNDMAFISERNSIVFRAGDSPIWNRNETILPMSWRLFQNTIKNPGKEYSLQTIPTLSSALDFDIRKNQPNFMAMLDKRMEQAFHTEKAVEVYRNAHGYSENDDYKISQLDPDIYSDDVMDIVNLYRKNSKQDVEYENDNEIDEDELHMIDRDAIEENEEQAQANAEWMAERARLDKKRYAGGMLGMSDLFDNGRANHQYDGDIITAFIRTRGKLGQDKDAFSFRNGNLCGADGTLYIRHIDESKDLKELNDAAKDADSRIYSEDEIAANANSSYEVTDAFYTFLVSLEKWDFANGEFERVMAEIVKN